MIMSGDKKVEYRDLTQYYVSRLFEKDYRYCEDSSIQDEFTAKCELGLIGINDVEDFSLKLKEFDTVTFLNEYQKDRQETVFEFKGVSIGEGIISWGANEKEKYFCICLGDLISCNKNKFVEFCYYNYPNREDMKVRYRREVGTTEAIKLIKDIEELKSNLGVKCPYFYRYTA